MKIVPPWLSGLPILASCLCSRILSAWPSLTRLMKFKGLDSAFYFAVLKFYWVHTYKPFFPSRIHDLLVPLTKRINLKIISMMNESNTHSNPMNSNDETKDGHFNNTREEWYKLGAQVARGFLLRVKRKLLLMQMKEPHACPAGSLPRDMFLWNKLRTEMAATAACHRRSQNGASLLICFTWTQQALVGLIWELS